MPARLTRLAIGILDRLARRFLTNESPQHLRTGTRGEEDAFFELRKLGYVMVARNIRSARSHGEIDLIAWDGDVLCFIEVKTRTSRAIQPAEAAVDAGKQQDLTRVARDFLRRMGGNPPFRFDIVSIYFEGAGKPEINVFKDAFR